MKSPRSWKKLTSSQEDELRDMRKNIILRHELVKEGWDVFWSDLTDLVETDPGTAILQARWIGKPNTERITVSSDYGGYVVDGEKDMDHVSLKKVLKYFSKRKKEYEATE